MAHRYDHSVDISSENHSAAAVYRFVGTGRRVLDVGGATGNLGRALTEAGNVVTVIDVDPAAVELAAVGTARAITVDLESQSLTQVLAGEQFDVVVFADVLEHLRNPAAVLRDAVALLADGGFVVISVPNVAHADVRLMLLEGRWETAEIGLLDDTHLRWFTLESLARLVESNGLHIADIQRITRPLFHADHGVRADNHSRRLTSILLADPEAETFQFVVRCIEGHGVGVVPLPTTLGTATLDEEADRLAQRVRDVERGPVWWVLVRIARVFRGLRRRLLTLGRR